MPLRSMPTNDAQLLARISSDATGEALRALYRAYAGELYGFALNALGDRGTAEEVVQEVFTRAWRHAEAFGPGAFTKGPFLSSDALSLTFGAAAAVAGSPSAITASASANIHPPRVVTRVTLRLRGRLSKASG
jgi:hypothetical protein